MYMPVAVVMVKRIVIKDDGKNSLTVLYERA